MIGKIARRLGFEQSVPVALIDDWHVPVMKRSSIELAPREGAASCAVDQFGRVQPNNESWTLELTFAAGARWVPLSAGERVSQKMVAPGVIETTVQTPSGPIVQRIAAGVVDGKPSAIIEVENTGGVAIAVGVVARPLRLDGRGSIGEASVDGNGISIDGHRSVRFTTAPASVVAAEGSAGDLLQALPEAGDGSTAATAKCRSGGAQAAAVWPLPHTATFRVVLELVGPTSLDSAIPTTADINRGWESHLKQGMRVEVDGYEVGEHLANASRSVLTMWPDSADTPLAVLAMSEMGFGRDAGRLFERLERCDDDGAVLRALARWAQLGEQAHQLDDLERILGRLAQAAHRVDNKGSQRIGDESRGGSLSSAGVGASGSTHPLKPPGQLAGPPWLADALVALGGRLHQIEQPDVAERVQGLNSAMRSIEHAADQQAQLTNDLDKRGVWPERQLQSSAQYVRAVRAAVIEDAGSELRLLPDLSTLWRGRTLDVFGLPIPNGTISFGLRWHGPRAALLWEASLTPEAPFTITAPGIDPDFVTHDREGETLLADPGWGES